MGHDHHELEVNASGSAKLAERVQEPGDHSERDSSSQLGRKQSPTRRVPVSCTKAFDSLYYCYSPFHQAKVYYQSGELDHCRGRLRNFQMCAMSRVRQQDISEVGNPDPILTVPRSNAIRDY
jgi:hypothetical protein